MSFHDVHFSKAVKVERPCGRQGKDYKFAQPTLVLGQPFNQMVCTLSEAELMEAVMGSVDVNGFEVETGLPHSAIMQAFTSMPEFSQPTQALKHS